MAGLRYGGKDLQMSLEMEEGYIKVIELWLVMMQSLDLILNILGSHWVVFVLWYDIHNKIYHCKCF